MPAGEPLQSLLCNLLSACLTGLLICSSEVGESPGPWRENLCCTLSFHGVGVWVYFSVGTDSSP